MANIHSGDVLEFPVSATQATFWYMYQLDREASAYTIPLGFRISGSLDTDVLRESLQAVVSRHEILRTTYCEKSTGELVQRVSPHPEFPFDVVTVSSDDSVEQERKLGELLEQEFRRPVYIDSEPVLRAKVYSLGESDFVFLLVVHHIATDHMAIGYLLDEMADNYGRLMSGGEVNASDPELQYADYVVWQKELRAETDFESRKSAWMNRLEPFSGVLDLPASFPRPQFQSFDGRDRYFKFSEETSELIRQFSKEKWVVAVPDDACLPDGRLPTLHRAVRHCCWNPIQRQKPG